MQAVPQQQPDIEGPPEGSGKTCPSVKWPRVWWKYGKWLLLLFLLIVIPILIVDSIIKVDDGEVAVLYSSITKSFKGVGQPGLHFSTPGLQGYRYSRRVVSQEVSLDCYSKEGLEVYLTVDAQFTYNVEGEQLINLFRTVGEVEAVQELVEAITMHNARVVCGNTSATDMYVNRAQVESGINVRIRQGITDDPAQVTGENAPVRQITLPISYSNQLKEKEAATERVNVALRERDPILIDSETKLAQAQFEKKTAIQDAFAEANRTIYEAEQNRDTIIAELEVLGQQLGLAATELGVTAQDLLDDVLDAQQRGQMQSQDLQLCLIDCRKSGSEFNCGTCYLVYGGGSGSNLMIDIGGGG